MKGLHHVEALRHHVLVEVFWGSGFLVALKSGAWAMGAIPCGRSGEQPRSFIEVGMPELGLLDCNFQVLSFFFRLRIIKVEHLKQRMTFPCLGFQVSFAQVHMSSQVSDDLLMHFLEQLLF